MSGDRRDNPDRREPIPQMTREISKDIARTMFESLGIIVQNELIKHDLKSFREVAQPGTFSDLMFEFAKIEIVDYRREGSSTLEGEIPVEVPGVISDSAYRVKAMIHIDNNKRDLTPVAFALTLPSPETAGDGRAVISLTGKKAMADLTLSDDQIEDVAVDLFLAAQYEE